MEQPPLVMVPCTRCALFIEARVCEFTSDGDPICTPCARLTDLETTQARARLEASDGFSLSDAGEVVHVTLALVVGIGGLLE